jgi:hypothetical protein
MTWVDTFREREDTCRRAPSAHNTQPWLLRYGRDEVTVHWDPARALPDSDPTGRDLFLSLGAFVEASLIVAADAGLAVTASIAVDPDAHRVARLLPAPVPYATPYSAAEVATRACARGQFRPGTVAAEVLAELAALGADVRQLPSRRVARLTTRADRWLWSTPPVVRELRQWLRLSPRHPRYALDGLTDRALAMSRPEASALAVVLRPAVYRIARRLGVATLLAAASAGAMRTDGSVAVLVGWPKTAEDMIGYGRSLLRVWLGLSRHGLAVHPFSQLLDCAATAADLGDLLALDEGESVVAVFRVGRPVDPPPRSARIPVAGPPG